MSVLFPIAEYWWLYLAFMAVILGLLALDLGVLHRDAREVRFTEAVAWCVTWVSLALLFNLALYTYARWRFPRDERLALVPGFDPEAAAWQVALEFLTGYVVEYSLSVDNIFVFVLVLGYFGVPARHQHRVLFYGILGALVFRAVFIALGSILMQFHWVVWIFGLLLIGSGVKTAFASEHAVEPERNVVIRIVRSFLPVTAEFREHHFFVRQDGRLWATPMLVALLCLEASDIVFAIDSVPAIFALTREPFIVFTSNIFAILGLRSMYFMLGGVVERFHLLRYGLAVVLVFVGLKMVWLDQWFGESFPSVSPWPSSGPCWLCPCSSRSSIPGRPSRYTRPPPIASRSIPPRHEGPPSAGWAMLRAQSPAEAPEGTRVRRLAGRVALITGAGRGFGREIALALAREGADVAVNYRASRQGAAEVVQSAQELGRRASAFCADVAHEDQVAAMVAGVLGEFGRLDILVNNAGVMVRGLFLDVPPEDYGAMFAINVRGTMLCARHALPGMIERRHGRIINLSSQLAQRTVGAGFAAYAATKGAVEAFTRALAHEVGLHGVTVNAIAPGGIETDMSRRVMTEEYRARRLGELPLGRFGGVEDVAYCAVMLAADEAGYLTGQILHPSGGWVMG